MPFSRPTLTELIQRTQADAETRLTGGAPLLPTSNIAILSRVLAGGVHGLYGYLAWIAQQVLPDTAEAEFLARHAGIWGIARLAATFAQGNVTLAGTNGSVAPAGTLLRRADGAEYALDSDATIVLGTATVAVTATAAGDAGDTAAGVGLTLVSAVSGITAAATVASGGLTGGADAEDDDALRTRLLARIQQPPQGGAEHDYLAWTFAAHPEVTRAWVYPEELGPGAVTVRAMTDGATSNGIPSATVIEAIEDYIDPLRPVTAAVSVLAPTAVEFDLEISAAPATAAVQASIEAAIADLLLREAEPGGTLLISHLREAISTAAGETDHTLIDPVADVVSGGGEILIPGTITWS